MSSEAETTSSQLEEEVKHVFNRIMSGARVADMAGVDDRMLASWYHNASSLYTVGQYKKAADLFMFLITMDGGNFDYVYGLASCLMMMGEYGKAPEMFALSFTLDVTNPEPLYYAARCYFENKQFVEAAEILEDIPLLCPSAKQNASVMEKIDDLSVMINAIKTK